MIKSVQTWIATVAAAALLAANVAAQEPTAPAPADTPAPSMIRIPAGTIVEVELAAPLSSRTSQIGDRFALRLAAPLLMDGREIAPAGTPGAGEVIDADSSGFGGRQGKLILSGRYLEIGGQQVRIRGMRITGVGRDRSTGAMALSTIPYVGIGALFVHGGEIEMPEGASGVARIAADFEVAPGETAQDAHDTNQAFSGETEQ